MPGHCCVRLSLTVPSNLRKYSFSPSTPNYLMSQVKPKTEPTSTPFFEVKKSAIQGNGAFASQDIKKGQRLTEYTGEIISNEEADKRYDESKMRRHHTFLFTLDDKRVIDGAVGGNSSIYINHSCEPNCEAVIDRGKIYIEATRDIAKGEEVLYDYQYERDDDPELLDFYKCLCGAPTCRGTIMKAETKRKPRKKTAKKATKKVAKKTTKSLKKTTKTTSKKTASKKKAGVKKVGRPPLKKAGKKAAKKTTARKTAAKKTASKKKAATRKLAKSSVRKTAKKATSKAAKRVAKKTATKSVRKGAKKGTKSAAKKITKKAVRKGTKKVARKVAKKAVRKAMKKTTRKVARKTR